MKTIYTHVSTTDEYGDHPRYAVIHLEKYLLATVKQAQHLCLIHDLAHVALRHAPESWERDHHLCLTGDTLHVSAIDFWFSCYPKWGGGTFTTTAISIPQAEALLETGELGAFTEHDGEHYLDLTHEDVAAADGDIVDANE